MTELIEKYYRIMDKYKKGEFGDFHLTLKDILEKSGELDLFDKMSSSEIQYLIDNSSGITKQMFIELNAKKNNSNVEIIDKQHFDVLAVPYDRSFVIRQGAEEDFKKQKPDPEIMKQIDEVCKKLQINNLTNNSPVLKKFKKL